MEEKRLDLCFKGERDYLHGTDIFDRTLAWLAARRPAVVDIDFAFRRMARRPLRAVVGPPPPEDPVAVCAFGAAGGRERAYLLETAGQVSCRYPYPEEELVRAMVIDADARHVALRGSSPHTEIELWVAMAKALHQRVFPQAGGRWLFVRGRFPVYASRGVCAERSLLIAVSLSLRLTRSEAYADGRKAGEIFFSRAD